MHGKSFSQLIADFLTILQTKKEQEQEQELPPITRSLRGILRHAELDKQTYHRDLEEKYLERSAACPQRTNYSNIQKY